MKKSENFPLRLPVGIIDKLRGKGKHTGRTASGLAKFLIESNIDDIPGEAIQPNSQTINQKEV
jgi:predicted DNA-binding protein